MEYLLRYYMSHMSNESHTFRSIQRLAYVCLCTVYRISELPSMMVVVWLRCSGPHGQRPLNDQHDRIHPPLICRIKH